MKNGIDYKDLIDLEYFINEDQDITDAVKHTRDRQLFLQFQSVSDTTEFNSNSLIKAWVNKRVLQKFVSPGQKSPGSIFTDLWKFLNACLLIKGIVAGILTGLIFFSYTGNTPVNVFHFLLFFVFTQLILVFVLLCSLFLRKMFPRLNAPSFYTLFFQTIFQKTGSFFQKQTLKRMGSNSKLNIDHAFSIVKVQSKTYGFLFYWPIFILFQLFGIGFNLGLLSTTLFKVSTSDLAFGWQSTIQMGSDAVHFMTRLLALPWLYLVPENVSHPTLQEIEGSRIVLKEGIYHLSTMNLVAWWPFLVFCLIFYGLFFRLFFYGFGKIMGHYSLKRIKLDSAICLNLVRRMQTPVVTTQATPEPAERVVNVSAPPPETHSTRKEDFVEFSPQVTLLPDEIFHLCTKETMQSYLNKRGLRIDKIYRFQESYEQDQELIKSLQNENWLEQKELTIIMEGWMVPLVDFISYLGRIRQILPTSTLIHLGLVGCPQGDNLTAVKEHDFKLWKKKIATSEDPHLEVFSLIPVEDK